MAPAILVTKLYVPPPPPKTVLRPGLIVRLNEGLRRKLILISAPAGFGKTTLVSEWVTGCGRTAAWLSLDEGDNDPARFLAYLIAALQTITKDIGKGILGAIQTAQSPAMINEYLLATLLNEMAAIPDDFILVLDDFHQIDSEPIDRALTFLLDHLPPRMHLVIATREDPSLPLARYRARGQLTELRAADLRFTPDEAAEFLNRVMGLNLTAENIAALETRTEGWIVGLQLAALSMQGREDIAAFIQAFTGSHHFVLDYLVEEVLQQQTESVQTFLLRTSILDRLCGPLCDAVLGSLPASGQETLEHLEHANLFIVPLDDERRWYRYHHLFADLLRHRLHQNTAATATDAGLDLAELHSRASRWYEDYGLDIEAFQHAAAANDVERAERLIDGKRLQLHFRGVAAELDWLKSLPNTVLDARPSLWVKYASALLVSGQSTGVEEKLQAAEAVLAAATTMPAAGLDEQTRDLIGQIAAARSVLALSQYQVETILVQSRRALEYLAHDNVHSRFGANWTMGMAYQFRGERAAAGRVYAQAISIAQTSGNIIYTVLAMTCLGQIQELENQLYPAAETYRRVLQLIGDYSPPNAAEVYLGLARICYEWNDLDAAEQHGQRSLQLARLYDSVIDRYILSEVFLARLKLARGDTAAAAAMLAETEQSVRRNNFVHRLPEVAFVQVRVLLRQGDLAAAVQLTETYQFPMCQARIFLAQGHPAAAVAVLEPMRRQLEAAAWEDERLMVMVVQAIALHAHGEKDKAVQLLGEVLVLAEPGGFIRLFVDEGPPMAGLLREAVSRGIMPDYIGKLLAAFEAEKRIDEDNSDLPPVSTGRPLIEPLSQRELEILHLIAQGLSNREIGERLFLALDTIKGHNRHIFDKLEVQSRTEAVARGRELGLL